MIGQCVVQVKGPDPALGQDDITESRSPDDLQLQRLPQEIRRLGGAAGSRDTRAAALLAHGCRWVLVKGADYAPGGTGPHYYNELWASPHQFDRVYHADVNLHVTEDGGKTMQKLSHDTKHVDHHAMAFNPDDENYILVGNDGVLDPGASTTVTFDMQVDAATPRAVKVPVNLGFDIVGAGPNDNVALIVGRA